MVLRPHAAWALVGALVGALAAAGARGEGGEGGEGAVLDVWVVAHSHDDVGWLRTVDEYYVYEVDYIISNVVQELVANPERRFIQVEIAFFRRWWAQQGPASRAATRRVVDRGQLRFVLGGVCMPDEATTRYDAIIDQTTDGHEFLLATFGVVPEIGWHIDPFGASNVVPWLYRDMGFTGHIINRIDWRLKDQFKEDRELEFVWRGSPSHGAAKDIFAHIMDSHYCTPSGFSWEHGVTQQLPQGDGDPPVIDRPPSPVTDSNAHSRALDFLAMAQERAAWFKTSNVLVPFGCDFTFQNAKMVFANLDKLMRQINDNPDLYGLRVHYSTLDDYMAAVKGQSGVDWRVRTEDFFPYADNRMSYWTGYYSTLPVLKGLCRRSAALLRAGELLYTLTRRTFDLPLRHRRQLLGDLELMRQATSIAQHHDAITGTERSHVADDYVTRLTLGTDAINRVLVFAFGQLLGHPEVHRSATAVRMALVDNSTVSVILFNSLAQPQRVIATLTELPGAEELPGVRVTDAAGAAVAAQLGVPLGGAGQVLRFVADVPALGFATYRVAADAGGAGRVLAVPANGTAPVTENEHLRVEFDALGRLSAVVDKASERSQTVRHDFVHYTETSYSQPSGAYIFHPRSAATAVYKDGDVLVSVASGAVYTEVVQDWDRETIQHAVRVYHGLDEPFVELVGRVGPIEVNTEVVSRIETGIETGGVFFTDNNGLEMQRRVFAAGGRDGDGDDGARIAGNYYPATGCVAVQDEAADFEVAVLVDRAVAASSSPNGALETVVHRRLGQDDHRGVGESRNDASTVEYRHWLLVGPRAKVARLRRVLALRLEYPPEQAYAEGMSGAGSSFSWLAAPLPEPVHLLSLRSRGAESESVLLRLQHLYARAESNDDVGVDVGALFEDHLLVGHVDETTLTGNTVRSAAISGRVTLAPMEIRTFSVEIMRAGDDGERGGVVVEQRPK